ncbi:MAG: hypothetical protein FJX47_07465 [Alphaproteobacteria bacterium]|nr:hypothetical protein [Alphaproteobacteria bacterium]
MASTSSLSPLLSALSPELSAKAKAISAGAGTQADLFKTLMSLVNQTGNAGGASAPTPGADMSGVPTRTDLAFQLLDALTAAEDTRDPKATPSLLPDFQLPAKLLAYAQIQSLL